MKRPGASLILLFVLFATAIAQPPDLRVRLFTVHDTRVVTVTPVASATVAECASCRATKINGKLELRAAGESVLYANRRLKRLFLTGAVLVESADGRARRVDRGVEISSERSVLVIVTVMTPESYVAEAVQGETASEMPPEALKAMAVVARSFAAAMRDRHQDLGFDLCDSTHCQNLRAEISPIVQRAVDSTRGETLWSAGTPAMAFHSKDCGGHSAASSEAWPRWKAAYLPAQPDPYCIRKTQPWKSEFSTAQISKAMAESGIVLPRGWDHLTVESRSVSGRAQALRFRVGAAAGAVASASTLRTALGRTLGWQSLKSDLYEVEQQGNRFIFTGHGVGHGVGLCQTGAAAMAAEGKSYKEILAFYYPGTSRGISAQGIAWRKHPAGEVDVMVVNESAALPMSRVATAALREAQKLSGISATRHFELRVYPSLSMFRDATGEPGWIAATTRGDVIETQNPEALKRAGGAQAVLRHEFIHALLESVAAPTVPLWFREGLAVYLVGGSHAAGGCTMDLQQIEEALRARSSEAQMHAAHTAAADAVAFLGARHGREQLMQWLRNGLPDSAALEVGSRCDQASQHSRNR